MTDTNLLPDVYLFDRASGCVTRISGSAEREWWTPSVVPAIDGAGSVVVFSTTQPDGDDDLSTDFDLWLRPTGRCELRHPLRPVQDHADVSVRDGAREQEPAVRGDDERLEQPGVWIDPEKLLRCRGGKTAPRVLLTVTAINAVGVR